MDSYYGPGDGLSDLPLAQTLRGGLTDMSDAWEEYMLTRYELKKPDRNRVVHNESFTADDFFL